MFVAILLLVVIGTSAGYAGQKARAILTTGYYVGYFKGATTGEPNNGHQVLWNCDNSNPNAISNPSSITKQQFVNLIKYYRTNNAHPGCSSSADTWGTRNTYGANFVIQTMRGVYSTGGSANFATSAEITDWEDRVMDSNVTMQYVSNYTFSINSAFNGDIRDDTWHPQNDTQPALVFRYSGSVVYVLKVSCGNPLGNMPGLPRKATLDRNATLTPAQVEAGNPISGTFTISNPSSVSGTVDYRRVAWIDRDGDSYVTSGDTTLGSAATGTVTVSAGGSRNVAGWTYTPGVNDDRICVAFRILPANSTTEVTTTAYDRACTNVGRKPYFQVYGGDTIVGVYQTGGGGTCSTVSDAGIAAWNRFGKPESDEYGPGENIGSGVEMATFALDKVYHFGSSLGSNNNPRYRTFTNFATNSYVNTTNGLFGGSFGSLPGGCDFVGSNDGTTVTSHTGNVSTVSGSGTETILPTTVATGTHRTIVVTGNVFIDHNITYASSGSWATPTDIPSFKLVVVGGNIYISPAVSRLDGAYLAQPNTSGTGGNIYTCGYSSYVRVGAGSRFSYCNRPLTVYGAFVGKRVFLDRSNGTLKQASSGETYSSNNAAETFVYSPEMWIPTTASTGAARVTTINGLPPRL